MPNPLWFTLGLQAWGIRLGTQADVANRGYFLPLFTLVYICLTTKKVSLLFTLPPIFFPSSCSPPASHSQSLAYFFFCLSLPWPRRLFPLWAAARFLRGEECTRGPRRAAINISSVLRPHLCRVLNEGIFMKEQIFAQKSCLPATTEWKWKIIERGLRHFYKREKGR